jgi:hypothetical protein
VEDFPSFGIYKFDPSGIRFQTPFGGGNLSVNDLHHQIRFGNWNETVYIWNSKWREVLQYNLSFGIYRSDSVDPYRVRSVDSKTQIIFPCKFW